VATHQQLRETSRFLTQHAQNVRDVADRARLRSKKLLEIAERAKLSVDARATCQGGLPPSNSALRWGFPPGQIVDSLEAQVAGSLLCVQYKRCKIVCDGGFLRSHEFFGIALTRLRNRHMVVPEWRTVMVDRT
jgi:hypothetical protein